MKVVWKKGWARKTEAKTRPLRSAPIACTAWRCMQRKGSADLSKPWLVLQPPALEGVQATCLQLTHNCFTVFVVPPAQGTRVTQVTGHLSMFGWKLIEPTAILPAWHENGYCVQSAWIQRNQSRWRSLREWRTWVKCQAGQPSSTNPRQSVRPYQDASFCSLLRKPHGRGSVHRRMLMARASTVHLLRGGATCPGRNWLENRVCLKTGAAKFDGWSSLSKFDGLMVDLYCPLRSHGLTCHFGSATTGCENHSSKLQRGAEVAGPHLQHGPSP